ncbi:MAG: J domain-containing protein [Sphingomonadales bacterium]
MNDPYKTLGVARSASAEDIKKAYRKLAKELHPDLHPGNEKISEQFKETSAAYAILGDEKNRKRFDRGEIDANGTERGFGGFSRQRQRAGASAGGGRGFGGFSFDGVNAEDIFADLFSGNRRGPAGSARGNDRVYQVSIDFLDAVRGLKKTISLESGKTLSVSIPADVRDGQQIRLKGQGGPGQGGGPAGDALIEVLINPHRYFRREGNDIHMDLPITLVEAVNGGKVRVPTIEGAVNLPIPAGSNTDRVLRLKGKGIKPAQGGPTGDQYVRLKVMLPDPIDDDLKSLIEEWSANHPYDVRSDLD